MTKYRLDVLAKLCDTIAARKSSPDSMSYTAELLSGGKERCAKKFGEEAIETVIAAIAGSRENLASEAADLLYHLLVLLEAAGLEVEKVMEELERRRSMGGLLEKASRAER